MSSTTTINFKLQVAPGAVEIFSVGSVDKLEKKLDEFGLTLDNVYMKNPKGSLVPLRKRLNRIGAGDQIKLFAVVSDSEDEDSGDDTDGEEVLIFDISSGGRRGGFGGFGGRGGFGGFGGSGGFGGFGGRGGPWLEDAKHLEGLKKPEDLVAEVSIDVVALVDLVDVVVLQDDVDMSQPNS